MLKPQSALDRGPFCFCYILKGILRQIEYGMNLKLQLIIQKFRKVIKLKAVNI